MKKLPLPALLLLSLFIQFILTDAVCKAGFGVSPPWVKNDHLLAGDTYEETIYLSRSPVNAQQLTDWRIEGDEKLVQWITIPNQDNLLLPEGEKVTPIKVIVAVPADAPLGDYKGDIYFKLTDLTQEAVEGSQISIEYGGNITVEISVVEPPKKPGLPGSTEAPAAEPIEEPANKDGLEEQSSAEEPLAETKPVAPECPACQPCSEPPAVTCPSGTSGWVILILALAALVGASAGLIFVLRRPKGNSPVQTSQPPQIQS